MSVSVRRKSASNKNEEIKSLYKKLGYRRGTV